MIEADAIEACLIALECGCTPKSGEPVQKAREQLAAIKAMEPQWLPAGKLPDAEGWWLIFRGGKIKPGRIEELGDREWSIGEDIFHEADMTRFRFAPMPRWEGPK